VAFTVKAQLEQLDEKEHAVLMEHLEELDLRVRPVQQAHRDLEDLEEDQKDQCPQ
jgi:hypothetical protein